MKGVLVDVIPILAKRYKPCRFYCIQNSGLSQPDVVLRCSTLQLPLDHHTVNQRPAVISGASHLQGSNDKGKEA